ncbi:Metallo-dependent phosphatase-like protein [Coniella lustricola]|uniref:Metallo-dependent phosphatase-like protein n=1 Tax=Coniella lustricola TaxID=2025994 RepID=A0A2T3ABV9_9PEZI|nr:Metallo-dependent phosphatase-like protein [Coniella lustricola]
MMSALRCLWASSLLTMAAEAMQPGAAKPLAAPMRDLQWAQLNFLHTTDTHGWHGGHLQESQYSADWGDYISFAHHMRQKADKEGVDLLLVDTGDRVEGNGLYDASTPKGQYTYDIFREQDIDIICTGNHELYLSDTADRERTQTVPNFSGKYLASNLDYKDPQTGKWVPMAQRYKKFQTKNQKLNVVAFGFLFDFTGNAANTRVQQVAETTKEQWFQDAIREEADVFVVIGHVGLRMDEWRTIYSAIRKQNWFTPIAIFGGHAHVRDSVSFDSKAFGIASGRYLETIGWMSVDGIANSSTRDLQTTSVSFHRRYIDNNLLGMYAHTGLNESTFPTEHGRNVSDMITKARADLNLDKQYGCAPQDYWMARTPYPSKDSIYTWLDQQVMPEIFTNKTGDALPRLAIVNTGAVRFDIFEGPFTIDTTYIVSPFQSKMVYIPAVDYDIATKVLPLLNKATRIVSLADRDPRMMASPEQWTLDKDIVYPELSPSHQAFSTNAGEGQKVMSDSSPGDPVLVHGYTTNDDIGTDGDDAIHSPINIYLQPNCIQAESGFPENKGEGSPEKVDLIFTDFITPWVILALKFSGGDYRESDIKLWDEAPFTDMVAGWIKEHWSRDC